MVYISQKQIEWNWDKTKFNNSISFLEDNKIRGSYGYSAIGDVPFE